ncbi:MAG: hypothetical protein KDM63_12885 [Verrucomicrobiae bacterium]|nr:hypothetical protein [Verrucomicrobiae bacterium]
MTRTFLAELETGLEDYRIDHGQFPLNPPEDVKVNGDRDLLGVEGARVLYQHLSGDWDLDGEVDPDGTVYVERLEGWSNSKRDDRPTPEIPRSEKIEGGFQVIDPFGSPVRYLAAPPGITEEHKKQREALGQMNPTFDLWSIGKKRDLSDESNWITNFETK